MGQAKREHGAWNQGGVDGGARCKRSKMIIQRSARMITHGGVNGGRSHGGGGADNTRGPTDGDCAGG